MKSLRACDVSPGLLSSPGLKTRSTSSPRGLVLRPDDPARVRAGGRGVPAGVVEVLVFLFQSALENQRRGGELLGELELAHHALLSGSGGDRPLHSPHRTSVPSSGLGGGWVTIQGQAPSAKGQIQSSEMSA